MFQSLSVRICTCFAIGLHPKVRKKLRNMLKAISAFRQTDKKLKVHRILKGFIEPIALFKYSAPKECCSCGDVQNAVVKKDECVELDLAPNFKHLTYGIHRQIVTVKDVDLGIVFKCLDNILETTSSITIIGVQPANNFTLSLSKPFIECLALTAISLRDPHHVLLLSIRRLVSQQIDGAVC